MRILEQNQDGMALLRRRPAKPSLIAGILFGAMAAIPAISGAELSGARMVTTLALATVAACLIWLGRASVLRIPLPAEFEKGRLPVPARIELGGSDSYTAHLVRSDGSSVLLFERDEPAGVVRDVLALVGRYSLPVRPGWALDEVAWAVLAQPGPARAERVIDTPIVVESWPLRRQRTAAYTSLWAGVFVLVSVVIMAVSPYRSGVTPSLLSVLLPTLTVVYVLAVGGWLIGFRERLTLRGTGIERLKLWFGRPLGRASSVETKVYAVFSVAPKSVSIRHALMATQQGPVAFAVDPAVAEKLSGLEHDVGPIAGRAAE